MLSTKNTQCPPKLLECTSDFLLYAQVELGFAEQSVVKYRDCLRQLSRILGDRPVTNYSKEDVLLLKKNFQDRQLKRESADQHSAVTEALATVLPRGTSA